MDIDLHDYKISVMASKKKSGCGKFLGDALRKKVCSGAIQPCRLCSEMTTNCVGHYGCCETCRLVQVRLKDIKPVVGEIRRMLASQRHKNESQKHATEDKTFVKELQVEGRGHSSSYFTHRQLRRRRVRPRAKVARRNSACPHWRCSCFEFHWQY